MEVVIGTYNHVLFGFKFEQNEDDGVWNFKPQFTDQGHAGCVKSLATGGKYLASGSSDETIRLFDMKKHIEVGTLMQQDGTISSLCFGAGHMLSGSEDGTVCIWKTKSWECEKVLKGHRGPINSLSMHPSGRLALSLSKDKTIKTWNLLTGRAAYTTNIKEVGEIVKWSPKGDCYAVVVGCKITFYKISGVNEPHVYSGEKYVLAIQFLTDFIVVFGGEDENIIIYDFEKQVVLQSFEAHKIRTKSIELGDENDAKMIIFTSASDGNVRAWSLSKQNYKEEPKLLASIDLPGRPTCMTVKLPERAVDKTVDEPPTINNDEKAEEKQKKVVKKKKKSISSDAKRAKK